MSKNEENKETGIKLNEAIERFTSNAEFERTQGNLQGCLNFRQLAEWLKDYKRLLEQEPKTGHWIPQDIHNCHTDFKCSECGYIHSFMHLYGKPTADYTYCPICGARMESEEV